MDWKVVWESAWIIAGGCILISYLLGLYEKIDRYREAWHDQVKMNVELLKNFKQLQKDKVDK